MELSIEIRRCINREQDEIRTQAVEVCGVPQSQKQANLNFIGNSNQGILEGSSTIALVATLLFVNRVTI